MFKMVYVIFIQNNSITIDFKTKAMNYKIITFCFVVLTSCFTYLEVNGQQSSPRFDKLSLSLAKELNFSIQENQRDSLVTWQERLLLHVDKPTIEKGRPLFFKAYTLTGPNRVRGTLSKVVKLELLNSTNEILSVQLHKIEDGMAQGEFKIPEKLDKGIYTLRAYTRWMQNYGPSFYYEQKLILGSDIKNDRNYDTENFNVTFYPEGGSLVAGIKNKLLLKVKNSKGQLIKVEGDIIDKQGLKIAPVVVFENRIMSTIFKPEFGQEYHFVPTNQSQKTYVLPSPMEEGYSLAVNNLNENTLSVGLEASEKMMGKQVWLKGEMSGVTYFDKQINFKKPFTTLEIVKEGIPFGVLTISLVDENNRVWSKRPVSISPANDFNLVITPLENDIADELSFSVRVTNEKGEPIETDFSLSVTSMESVVNNRQERQNFGFLWEQNISEGSNQNQARLQTFMKDLEILTSEDSKAFQEIPNRIQYPFQNGLDLFGYAYDLNNNLLKNTELQVLSTSERDLLIMEVETDAKGFVRIQNLQLEGKNKLVFRTKGEDTSSRFVKIIPLQKDYNQKAEFKQLANSKRAIVQASPWQPDNSGDLIELNEVEIIEKKKETKKDNKSIYGVEPTRVATQDTEKPKTIPELFLGIPGVQVVNLGGLNPQIRIPRVAGAGQLLWVIDALPLMQPTSLRDVMNLISAQDVDRIEFIIGPEAAVYGTRASAGVIVIYTRTGQNLDLVNRKDGSFNFQGFNEGLSFDSYAQELAKRPKKFEGRPTTIFWNSSIKTNSNGEALVKFTSPIAYEKLNIKVSTVSRTGKMASVRATF